MTVHAYASRRRRRCFAGRHCVYGGTIRRGERTLRVRQHYRADGAATPHGLGTRMYHKPTGLLAERVRLPLGQIVATCTLVDVAPIGGPFDFRTGVVEGDEGDYPGRPVVVCHPRLSDLADQALILDRDGRCEEITDQLPYGDYTPGRWAWLLDHVRPLAQPIPCRGRQGLWTLPDELTASLTAERQR